MEDSPHTSCFVLSVAGGAAMSDIPSREEVEAAISKRKDAYKILAVESQANRILKALWEEFDEIENTPVEAFHELIHILTQRKS